MPSQIPVKVGHENWWKPTKADCSFWFTKISETGLVLTSAMPALPRGMRQISIWVYYEKQNGLSDFVGLHQFSRPTIAVSLVMVMSCKIEPSTRIKNVDT